jgi:hypothetical protein
LSALSRRNTSLHIWCSTDALIQLLRRKGYSAVKVFY